MAQRGGSGKRAADDDPMLEAKKTRQAEVAGTVKDLNASGVRQRLDELSSTWQLDDIAASFISTVERAFTNFDLGYEGNLSDELQDKGSYGLRKLDDSIGDHEVEAIALYNRARELGMFSAETPDASELLGRMVKVIEMVYYAKRIVLATAQAKLAVHQLSSSGLEPLAEDLDARLGSWALRFRWIDAGSTSPMQKLLLHLLDTAMEKRFRKQGGYCYEPVVVDGRPTHAWRPVCEIKTFVHESIQKELAWEQWCNATASMKNIPAAIDYLTCCKDYQFPELIKQRGVYSFRNGVYLCREDVFKPATEVPDTVVACKFFDCDMDPEVIEATWVDIPTPYFDSIMNYQGFEADVKRWMYIMMGRLLYALGASLDGWQVIPFMKGQAGSGKSTILLKVAKNFFESVDVGVLSNNIERTFGIGAFHDKCLFVAPEIKNDLRIEQAEFQSIVSGEDLQINVKHQKAFATCWTVPGLLAGNEVPGWADNAGSIQRRIVLFDFVRTVLNGDMKLGEKLDVEAPLILIKCNRAYQEMARQHGQKNIWTVLPSYFRGTRDEMAQAVNSVEAFLASTDVKMDSEVYCPFDEFKAALKTFETHNGYRPTKYTWDFFRGPLSKNGVVRQKERREYRGRTLTREYLIGIDLVDQQADSMLG